VGGRGLLIKILRFNEDRKLLFWGKKLFHYPDKLINLRDMARRPAFFSLHNFQPEPIIINNSSYDLLKRSYDLI
jgi:hypothetical protein